MHDDLARRVPDLDHEANMRAAIIEAQRQPQYPFGAVIVAVASGEIVARGFNRGRENPTWHGEIDALNKAAAVGPPDWQQCILYTTAEPCPMCQAAILWSGLQAVIYGTSIPTLQAGGWWQLDIRAADVIRSAPDIRCGLLGGVLAAECDDLFRKARN